MLTGGIWQGKGHWLIVLMCWLKNEYRTIIVFRGISFFLFPRRIAVVLLTRDSFVAGLKVDWV
jgi:hypothetical protein